MNLCFTESKKILRKGRAALVFRTRLPDIAAEGNSITALCERAALALEGYAMETLLPKIEKMLTDAPRRNRLHATQPLLSLICDGEVIRERWLSLSLTVLLEEEGGVICRKDFRVWDMGTGRLCPLEFFLPRSNTGRYLRWSFLLKGDSVWGIPARKGVKNTFKSPELAGKMKIIPQRY